MKKRWMNQMVKVHNWSILKQQMFIYIIAGMLPLFIVTSIIILSLTSVLLDTSYDDFYEEAESVNMDMIKNINDVEAVMSWIVFDNALHKLLIDEYESPLDYYERFETVHASIGQLRSLYEEVDKIEFLHNNPTTTSGSEFLYVNGALKEEYDYYMSMDNIDQGVIEYVADENRYTIYQRLNLYKGNPKYQVLARVRLNGELFSKAFDNDREIQYYFLDTNGEVVYSNTGEQVLTQEGSRYLVYESLGYTTNRFKGFQLYSRISRFSLIKDFINVYIFIIVFMIGLFILSYYLLKKLIDFSSKRLVGFSNHMDEVTDELTKFNCEVYGDEVGNAIDNYNKMVELINEMIIEKNQNELREKDLELENTKAKLYVLYSQINPHFLSNTLNCIKMNCIVKDEKETALILGDLSKMFRSLMLYSEPMAALWQEIDFIETYLKIQKFRFGDKLEYSIIVDDLARLQAIPRMTLQPLVENSCIHGIQKKAEGGTIQIHSYVKDNIFSIIISDDGIGIGEEELKEIRSRMESKDIEETSIGIINVYKRLKFYYHDRLTFSVDKTVPEGTKFTIKIVLEESDKELLKDNVED